MSKIIVNNKTSDPSSTNLLGYWNFDTSSWLDSSGNGYNLTTDPNVTLGTGIISGGAVFGFGYIGTSTPIWKGTETALSIACWVKIYNITNSFFCFNASKSYSPQSASGPALNVGDEYFGRSGCPSFNVYLNNAFNTVDQINYNTPINDGTWHHLVGTWNRYGNITLYLDGVVVAKKKSLGLPINSTISYGSLINAYANGVVPEVITTYVGAPEIDELYAYARELTISEVRFLYNKANKQQTKTIINDTTATQYLVVGGGGGTDAGGVNTSNTPGAGGQVIQSQFYPIINQTYSILVGSGGTSINGNNGNNFSYAQGFPGGASTITSVVTAIGGGGGYLGSNLPNPNPFGNSSIITGTINLYGETNTQKYNVNTPNSNSFTLDIAPNTGCGAGNFDHKTNNNGSDGIVVLSTYKKSSQFTTTGSPTIKTVGVKTIIIYNGSGTITFTS